MKNEAIELAAERFREKIQTAQNSNNRSQDIFRAIREFLEEIGTNIPNAGNTALYNEIIPGIEELRNKAEEK